MSQTPSDRRKFRPGPDLPSEAAGNQSVLVVEDQAVMRALLRDFLQSSFPGLTIIEAPDGARALKLAQEHQPGVVLMDINLPDANGIELTSRILALAPDTRVIMVTSQAGSAYMEHARAAGAFAYVTKDMIFDHLIPALARALNARGPGQDD